MREIEKKNEEENQNSKFTTFEVQEIYAII